MILYRSLLPTTGELPVFPDTHLTSIIIWENTTSDQHHHHIEEHHLVIIIIITINQRHIYHTFSDLFKRHQNIEPGIIVLTSNREYGCWYHQRVIVIIRECTIGNGNGMMVLTAMIWNCSSLCEPLLLAALVELQYNLLVVFVQNQQEGYFEREREKK